MPSAYIKAEKENDLEILLHIPQGMVVGSMLMNNLDFRYKGQRALRLEKGLYGLVQSSRLRNLMLHDILMSLSFRQCYTDDCLYIKTDTNGKTLLGIYIDDVVATGTSIKKVDEFLT